MNVNIPKPFIILGAFLFALVLYWPALQGTPIWDDNTFWFSDPNIIGDYSYLNFWKYSSWPLSNSIERFLYGLWGRQFLPYHLISLSLHFINSYLVFILAKKIKFISPLSLFLFFLLSPVCVISVGWMIQIKTLTCFFFGILSLLTFLKAIENPKWIVISWPLFILCLASKSALITLPLVMVMLSYKKLSHLRYLLILPFFIFSGYAGHRLLSSPVTIKAVDNLLENNVIPHVALNEPPQEIEQVDEPVVENQKVDKTFVTKTLAYYFWQAILPIDNAPVKGSNFENLRAYEYIHLIFIVLIILIFLKDTILYYLLAGHLLLLPFLGLVAAPYMAVTWVSDQHLYAVLPAFLGFWILIFSKIKTSQFLFFTLLFGLLFSYKTYESSHFYKDEFNFYRESLRSNPTNLAIAYNLAFAYLKNGEYQNSLNVLENIYYLSQHLPELKKRQHYNQLMMLYTSLKYPEIKINK